MSRNRQRFYQRIEPRRVHGAINPDTMSAAMARATLLTEGEQAELLAPARHAFERMRQGQAGEADWVHLVTACAIALAIEDGGVVKGLAEVLTEADLALAAIAQRAMDSGTGWKPPTLYAAEILQLQTLIRMHAFQLSEITWGEHRKAQKHAVSSVVSRGGRAIQSLSVDTGAPC